MSQGLAAEPLRGPELFGQLMASRQPLEESLETHGDCAEAGSHHLLIWALPHSKMSADQ